MLSEGQLRAIGNGLSSAGGTVRLVLHPADGGGESAFGELLERVAGQVAGAAGGAVVVERGTGDGVPGLPCLSLHARDGRTVRYLAAPEGHEPGRSSISSSRSPGDPVRQRPAGCRSSPPSPGRPS